MGVGHVAFRTEDPPSVARTSVVRPVHNDFAICAICERILSADLGSINRSSVIDSQRVDPKGGEPSRTNTPSQRLHGLRLITYQARQLLYKIRGLLFDPTLLRFRDRRLTKVVSWTESSRRGSE